MSNGLCNTMSLLDNQIDRQIKAAVSACGVPSDFSSGKVVNLHGDNLPVIHMDGDRTLECASKDVFYDSDGHHYSLECLTEGDQAGEFFALMDELHGVWSESKDYVRECPFRLGDSLSFNDIEERAAMIGAEVESFGSEYIGENLLSVKDEERDLNYVFVLIGTTINGYLYSVASIL